jgi:hypothetical protein
VPGTLTDNGLHHTPHPQRIQAFLTRNLTCRWDRAPAHIERPRQRPSADPDLTDGRRAPKARALAKLRYSPSVR